MIRYVFGGLALVCSMLAPSAITYSAPRDVGFQPMRFEVKREGPAEACGDQCRTFLFANGLITPDTAAEFERFTQKHDVRGATMVLDSNGGSVLGALALGRVVRSLGLTTTVGKPIPLASADKNDPRARLTTRATCESMCTFVLLAGVKRYVMPDAHVLVHQIWLGDRRDDATAATYTAEDLVLVQHDIGRLVRYVQEMGGTFELLEATLRIPPWEPLRDLTREELRRMALDMTESNPAEDYTAAIASTPAPGGVRRQASLSERGWVLIDRSGLATLARRHPLTVRGDDIGSFDLTFACNNSDTYAVSYVEQRARQRGAVKQIEILVGGKIIALQVVSSEAKASGLDTFARATVPAALVKEFADPESRSLVIETATTAKEQTAVRIGNAGAAPSFAQFAAACSKQRNAEVRRERRR